MRDANQQLLTQSGHGADFLVEIWGWQAKLPKNVGHVGSTAQAAGTND